MRLDVKFGDPWTVGWSPIIHLAHVIARLTGGTVLRDDFVPATKMRRLQAHVSVRKRRGPADRALLVIARRPAELRKGLLPSHLLQQYGTIVAWVVDAMWHDEIPRGYDVDPYDLIAVPRPNDIDPFRARVSCPVMCFARCSDVLAQPVPGQNDMRTADVLRVGRQPAAWADDTATRQACDARGLRFADRPPLGGDVLADYAAMVRSLGQTRMVIAHCNLAAPARYTHPSQAYLTERWTDALAAGAIVAGVPPLLDRSIEALWDGALLPFERIDLSENLDQITAAMERWTPAHARRNHMQALGTLDIRHRMHDLAERLGVTFPILDAERAMIAERQAQARQAADFLA